jgi:CxxC-x17-CxxC domain-containing protein
MGKFHKDRNFGPPRQMHQAVCADCGDDCEVPFRPTNDRPIYCSMCFGKHKGDSQPSKFGGNKWDKPRFEKRAPALPDYSAQFKMLNEKLDKLFGLLTSASTNEKPAKKKETKVKAEKKPATKTAKAKTSAKKKTAAKKKK